MGKPWKYVHILTFSYQELYYDLIEEDVFKIVQVSLHLLGVKFLVYMPVIIERSLDRNLITAP